MHKLFVAVLLAIVYCTTVNGAEPCAVQQPACPQVHGTEDVLTVLPVVTDCSKYIMCDQGVAIIRPCPPDLVFNAEQKVCDFANRTQCVQC
ncbi:unnamed protein product [Hermetia illucens]|uniref:Chitin-binding type-2 domain-containing protein n=1 Tax=Hermetia illucens TaxID=343691 RepID=A0A7R8V099_HERIL|nr:peritrophin-1-like [Hermetia illucens]CAD7090436.1 unnamed protein product [Hermetia illucens]